MKKLIAMAAVTIASASAYAGVSIMIRGDYDNTPEYESRDINTTLKVPGSSIFRGQTAKIDMDGKVGDGATVTARINAGSLTAYASGDTLLEYAMIHQNFGNGWSVHAGKLESQNGGFEHESDVVGDVYLATLANGGIGGYVDGLGASAGAEQLAWTGVNATTGAAFTVPFLAAGNQRGIQLGYKMGDQKFDFQVTNSTNHGAGSDYKRNNFGLYWDGSFMDKMLMPTFGYMVGSRDTFTTNGEDTYANLGLKMKFGMTGVLVEYFANQTKNTLVVGANADKITSIYALVDFAMDAWKPFLKVESSEYRKNDDGSNALSFKRTAYNVGVEMMPKANDAFRYHLAIASTADKYGTAGTKDSVTWMQVMLGLKYSTDLLK